MNCPDRQQIDPLTPDERYLTLNDMGCSGHSPVTIDLLHSQYHCTTVWGASRSSPSIIIRCTIAITV